MILGHNTGWVFVDRVPNPTSALVWVLGQEGFFCLGDWSNDVFLAEIGKGPGGELGKRVLSCGFDYFDISGDSPGWDKALLSAFASNGVRDIQTGPQYVYRYGDPKWREVPGRAAVRPIDGSLLSSGVSNLGFLTKKIQDRWVSLEGFLKAGLGYCMIVDDQLASVCFSGWAAGPIHAVTIETLPEFRRKGLAKAVAAALMEDYERRGISPHWDVMPSNTASIALAESLGLVRAWEYNVHFFRIARR